MISLANTQNLQAKQRIIDEAFMLVGLDHPNILKGIRGFHHEEYHEELFCIVTEFCQVSFD